MHFEPSLLEAWMRRYYAEVDIDIGSSGVCDLTLGEVRELGSISCDALDEIVLRDSSSYGGDSVRDAVASRWGSGDGAWVMVTHGASEAIYLIANALVEPGDEIVVLEPSYHSHSSIARSLGATVRPWRLEAKRQFVPDTAELAALVSGRTRALIVNFPHNPTGATITADQQADLVEIARDVGAYLVWDAAFAELTYDAPLPDPIHTYDRAISIGTLSKAYGLPGLRFGWCIAPPDVLARLVDLRDRMTLHLSPLIEFVAARVIRNADVLLERQLSTVRANTRELSAWAASQEHHVDLIPPRGGVTAFPRIIGVTDTEPLCHALARERRVLLVPGACFGDSTRVRLGFGGATPSLRRGLEALADALVDGDNGEVRRMAACSG